MSDWEGRLSDQKEKPLLSGSVAEVRMKSYTSYYCGSPHMEKEVEVVQQETILTNALQLMDDTQLDRKNLMVEMKDRKRWRAVIGTEGAQPSECEKTLHKPIIIGDTQLDRKNLMVEIKDRKRWRAVIGTEGSSTQ
ncbi:hypothetical protein Bbelb_229010 [Branchiostoma belcheri]|nr:hypothetical protein Bbelb_229010 [Branchiostoma belcheri]